MRLPLNPLPITISCASLTLYFSSLRILNIVHIVYFIIACVRDTTVAQAELGNVKHEVPPQQYQQPYATATPQQPYQPAPQQYPPQQYPQQPYGQ